MDPTKHDERNWPKNTHHTLPDPLFETPEEGVSEKIHADIEYIFYHPETSFASNASCIQGVFTDGLLVTITSDKNALQQAKNSAERSKRRYIIISKEKKSTPLQDIPFPDLSKYTSGRIDLTELYTPHENTEEKERNADIEDTEQTIPSHPNESASSELLNEQVLEFIVADTHFAISLLKTREIVTKPDIIYQPDALPHVRGTIVHRTRAIPVIDLRSLFAMPEKNIGRLRERLIVIHGIGGYTCSILVDTVLAVTKIEQYEINDPIREHPSASFACGSSLRKDEREKYVMHILDADSIIQYALQKQ
jgi:chemotaxis signal transduction protein